MSLYSEYSDEQLIEKIQIGEQQALSEIIKRYYKDCYRLSYRYLINTNDAQDITQTVFLKLWENPFLWKLKIGIKFKSWLYKVVINLCLDKNKKITHESLDNIEHEIASNDCVINDLEKNNNIKMMKEEITRLPKRQQMALNLCFYDGLSNEQAAIIMGISVEAVKSLLMRAKYKLYKQLN